MKYTKVNSVEHLKELVEAGHEDFVRAAGIVRSSKRITPFENVGIEVFNYIDDSVDVYSWDDLNKSDNYIADMIECGQLFLEEQSAE